MNFFQNLNENLNDNDGLTIRITKTADGLAVSVLPDARVKNMAPINMEGTPAEIDEHFMATVTKGITIQKEFKSNLDELEAAATAEINAKKQKASAKAKPKAEESDSEEETAPAPKAEKAPKPVKEKKLPKGMDALLKRYTDSGSDELMQKYCISEITKALVKEKWEQAEIDALLAKHGPSASKPELPADAPFMGGQAGIDVVETPQSVQLDPEPSNAIAELNLEQEQTEQAIADEAVNDLTPKEEEEDGLLF